ncbi:aldo/keto reductase [Enterococcus devriesei]
MSQIDQSLQRLQTDYVDLYIIHRWDYDTPIEETMEALNDVVKAGKARYIGASAMYAYQFQKANNIAEKNGWAKFISMQNHLNLIYREEEREMLPYCRSEKIALTPYSPMASGRLIRDRSDTTKRSTTDEAQKAKYDETADRDQLIIDRVTELAVKYDTNRVNIALGWLLQKNPVVAPVIGATKMSHIETAVGAVDFKLTQEDVLYLEEPYIPHKVIGHN